MTDDSILDELPVGTIVVVGALLLAALTLPTFAPGTGPEEPDASNGTIVTPDGTELEEVNRGPIDGLNVLPGSHLMDDSPTVHASTGAQTMRVETMTVDGEPALNLSDDRTHEGRWVAVPTEWFKGAYGEIPSVARIAHEDSGTYTEPLQVRGDSAAFYVRGFSTNTVTFGGELVIQDRPAVDGTRHTYQLDSRDSVDDVSINLTGVENTAPESASAQLSDGGSLAIDVDGTLSPRNESVTITGHETTASESATIGTLSDGRSATLNVGGNRQPKDAQITLSADYSEASASKSGSGTGPVSLSHGSLGSTDGSVSVTTSRRNSPKFSGGWYRAEGKGDSTTIGPFDTSDLNGVSKIRFESFSNIAGDFPIDVDGQSFATISDDCYDCTRTVSGGAIDVSNKDEVNITVSSGYQEGFNTGRAGEEWGIVLIGPEASVTVDHPGGSESLGTGGSAPIDLSSNPSTIDISSPAGNVEYDVSWTKRNGVENVDLTAGSSSTSHSGVLDGSVAKPVTLSPGSQTLSASYSGETDGLDVSASWTEVTATEDPSVTVGGETVSHSGLLSDGETITEPIDLSTGQESADVSVSGPADVSVSWMEVSQTRDPVVEVNGETVGYSGTLNDGETVSLDASASWLREGSNNISVNVGDGSYSGAGPEPKVELEYRHDLESPRTVLYESEALSERYNVTKTYTNQIADATLRIPHARDVFSMRSVEYRLNESGSWSSVPQYATNLSGTTLSVDVSEVAGNPVPAGTTVEIRSAGSRVDVRDGEISVQRATPVGFDLNSRIQLDSWSSGSYLEVGETAQGELTHYATNESYPTESDYVELYSDGEQRFYAPNATSGSTLTLQTLSARVSPDHNSMRVRVPDGVNATRPRFVVEPASVVGDSWSVEYVAGTDGEYYAAVDKNGDRLGGAEKPSAIEVSRDDVGLVEIVAAEPPTPGTDTVGGGVFATLTTGNLPSLTVLFGGVAMLFVAGTRPAASRDAIDGLGASLGGVVGQVPRVGPALGSALESAVSSVGSALVSVGENRLLSGAIAAAVAVAAGQAGLYEVGSEVGAILAVGGIAVGSLYVLREAGEFTTARWIAIVAVAGVVAIQGLGEGDLLAEFVNSDAFLIAVLMGGYAVIQLVREYRANNDPNDDRPQIVIGGAFDSGDDQEGSD